MKYLFLLLLSTFSLAAWAQTNTIELPYKRFPTLPAFKLLLADSTTKYTKYDVPRKKPVMLMVFSPDCNHCQHTAEELVKYKAELKNIHIIMATLRPLWEMNAFVEQYRLNELPNVVVGKDFEHLLPAFYGIHSIPYHAFYNKKGDLISGFEGSMTIAKILERIQQ